MNPRHSNRTLAVLLIIMVVTGTIILVNVLFTMVTHIHFRSGVNISEYKEPDTYSTNILKANRGTIYDRTGEIIAKDEDTYTLVAYLDESRRGINDTPAYIEDIDKTAHQLASVLDMKEDRISKILRDAREDGLYQTELGTKGKNLSAETKEKIEAMELTGISFTKTVKRNYPQSSFAAHLIGYANYDDQTQQIVGKMGLEATLNEQLTGEDGKEVYQKDVDGNVLAGTKYTESYARDGNDVYLTLDNNVQLALQSSLKETMEKEKAERAWGLVVEVETGKILGWASMPSFDQNDPNIEDYRNLPSEYLYEPGSVMKGVTYSAAIDSGNYPYNKKYKSGVFYYYTDEDGKIVRSSKKTGLSPIYDALRKDYGTISFDQGFIVSSNIAICELLTSYLDPEIYREYTVDRFKFTQKVDIPYIDNLAGNMNFTYASEKLNTGFGQGIAINSLQMVQAYTAILNDGKMMRPYVVDKIVDPNTGKTVETYEPKQIGEPIKQSTSEYMRELMYKVVNDKSGSGYSRYRMDDVEVIGKTGTGQIANEKGVYGDLYTLSFLGAAPADDPKVMVYYVFEGKDILSFSGDPFKETMKAALVATNVTDDDGSSTSSVTSSGNKDWKEFDMPALTNHTLDYANKKLKALDVEKVVIGKGDSVIRQYPQEDESMVSGGRVFLLTDETNITMPDMSGWTKKDLTAFWSLTGISVEMDGSGVVTKQNIKKGKTIDKETQIKVTME